jgi:hypothetical protein
VTPELEALGRRAAACKAFHWMPGMLSIGGLRFDGVSGDRPVRVTHERAAFAPYEMVRVEHLGGMDPVPDLSDPATLGCLLALVREAWAGDVTLVPRCLGTYDDGAFQARPWAVYSMSAHVLMPVCAGTWTTEAEALVSALEAAP